MLSYISLNKENWKENSYIALNGLSKIGLDHFLDVHPNNKNALELYNRYVNDLNETKEIYINNYGPLTLDSINQNSWQWVKTWPWEGSVK